MYDKKKPAKAKKAKAKGPANLKKAMAKKYGKKSKGY